VKNGKIIFIEVPKSLADEIKSHQQDDSQIKFNVDPAIPLPIDTEGLKTISPKNLAEILTWEMILSGMMKIIAEEKKIADNINVSKNYDDSEFLDGVKPHWINYYRQFVLILKPEIYNEFTGAAIIKARNRDFDAAMEIISILEGLFPLSPQILLNKALIQEEEAAEMERKGCEIEAALENDKALESYTKALQMEPVLPELYFNLGYFYTRKKDFGKVKEYFTEYLTLADDPDKKEKAEKIIEEIEKTGLDDVRYIESLDLIRQGKEEDALLLIRDFLEEHPRVWNAWFVLGWALRKQKRYSDALAAFRKALELGGGTPDTRNETAICLMELGEYSEARKELEAALRDEPENVKIISNLGVLALKKDNHREAAGFFRTVLELNPQDPLAKKFFQSGQ